MSKEELYRKDTLLFFGLFSLSARRRCLVHILEQKWQMLNDCSCLRKYSWLCPFGTQTVGFVLLGLGVVWGEKNNNGEHHIQSIRKQNTLYCWKYWDTDCAQQYPQSSLPAEALFLWLYCVELTVKVGGGGYIVRLFDRSWAWPLSFSKRYSEFLTTQKDLEQFYASNCGYSSEMAPSCPKMTVTSARSQTHKDMERRVWCGWIWLAEQSPDHKV